MNRPTFEPHDDFILGLKKTAKVTREQFIEYIRNTHDDMRKLSQYIKQYDHTFDEHLKEWDGMIDDYVNELNSLHNDFEENKQARETVESERVSNEEERIANEQARELAESERNAELGDMDSLYERIYPISKNLFNPNQLTFGGRLNRNTGGIIDSDKDCYTEYIPVKENKTYTISKQGEPYSVVAYDLEYNRIAGYLIGGTFGDTTINTPVNTSFLRYSFFLSDIDYEKLMINEGNEILPFEEYRDPENDDKTISGVFNYLLDKWEENVVNENEKGMIE